MCNGFIPKNQNPFTPCEEYSYGHNQKNKPTENARQKPTLCY